MSYILAAWSPVAKASVNKEDARTVKYFTGNRSSSYCEGQAPTLVAIKSALMAAGIDFN